MKKHTKDLITWGRHASHGGAWIKLHKFNARQNSARLREGFELEFHPEGEHPAAPCVREAAGEAAHTPTPWQPDPRHAGEIMDNMGNRVAQCFNYGTGMVKEGYVAPWHQYQANAAFIVRACNSHDTLVEALEAYIAWHEGKTGSLSSSEKLREAKVKARAALASAKGVQS